MLQWVKKVTIHFHENQRFVPNFSPIETGLQVKFKQQLVKYLLFNRALFYKMSYVKILFFLTQTRKKFLLKEVHSLYQLIQRRKTYVNILYNKAFVRDYIPCYSVFLELLSNKTFFYTGNGVSSKAYRFSYDTLSSM